MAKKDKAYVDTSAFIAFIDRSDSHHEFFRGLFADPPELVTSSLVVAEGHGWFLKRYDRTRALQFVSFIEDLKPLHILATGQSELAGGYRILRRYSDQDLTLVDAVGLYMLKMAKVQVCWSTDFHMSLTGVPLAIHQV